VIFRSCKDEISATHRLNAWWSLQNPYSFHDIASRIWRYLRFFPKKRKLMPRFSRIPEKRFGLSYVYDSKGGVLWDQI
jgi:hypothetical protein